MKTRKLLLGCLTLLSLSVLSQSAKPIDVEWLNGDQPKLLTAMANSSVSLEELNGTSLSLGTLLGGWHAQAVGQYGDYIYVAFSDGKLLDQKTLTTKKDQAVVNGKLWIYNTKTKQGQLKDLEKGYAHPCSIQVTGQYLTIALEAAYGTNQEIGIERANNSLIVIYDLAQDPNCSVEVSRVAQEGVNSGGAGLAYHPQLKRWYLFVDQDYEDMDARGVVIYKSSEDNINSWQKTPIAKYPRFGTGAGVNLITASDNSIWGLYFDTYEGELPHFSNMELGADEVRLFKLIDANGNTVQQRDYYSQVVSIGAPLLKSAGELLANRPGMRFGAGIRNEGGKLELLTCQRNMTDNFKIKRTRLETGDRSQVMFVNFAKARGEIKISSVSNPSQNTRIEKLTSKSGNAFLQSPIKADVNYMPPPKGFRLPGWSDALDKQSSAPLILFHLEGGDIKGYMQEFYTVKKTDQRKN
jgi:hypothetical protein